MTETEKCQDYIRSQLDCIDRNEDSLEVFRILSEREEGFSKIAFDLFEREYAAVHQALACHAWLNVFEENEVDETSKQKLFLQEVMARFESPEHLERAAAFSEYWAVVENDSDAEPNVVTLAKNSLNRLQAKPEWQTPTADGEMPPCFLAWVEILEGIRVSYENEFEQFILDENG